MPWNMKSTPLGRLGFCRCVYYLQLGVLWQRRTQRRSWADVPELGEIWCSHPSMCSYHFPFSHGNHKGVMQQRENIQPLQVSTCHSWGKLTESILHPLPAQDETQYWHIIQSGFTRFPKMAKAQNTWGSQCYTSWFSESVRRFFQLLLHSRGDLGVLTSHLQRISYNLKLILNDDQFIGVGSPIAKPASSTEFSKTNVFLLSSKFQVEVETTTHGKRQSG